MLNILIRKFKRNLTDYGFFIAVKKMILYPFMDIYKRKVYLIYKKDLVKYEPVNKNNPSFSFKFFDKKNIDQKTINQILAMEEWLIDKIHFILDNGGLCLVALDNSNVAGFNIVSFNEVNILLVEMQRKFKRHQAWSEQITVRKDYRNKGLGSILRYKMFDELKTKGYKALYGGTMWDNWSNIELSKKVGFEIFLKIKFLRILNKKKYSFERIYPNTL
ncbi:MAG: GNAT family N-acetyltransferase [Candidatus Lokiarchaeota archaeon]|nr:GNAT family N-acetyltransferase [Candidatus Lokiarchaeota archaeon]